MPAAPDPPAPAPIEIDHRRDALLIAGLPLAVHVGGAFEWLAPPRADLARAGALLERQPRRIVEARLYAEVTRLRIHVSVDQRHVVDADDDCELAV